MSDPETSKRRSDTLRGSMIAIGDMLKEIEGLEKRADTLKKRLLATHDELDEAMDKE